MALCLKWIVESYEYVFNELSDPNANKYYLMGSPLPIILVLCAYYYYIYYGGVRMMKNRKPYKLKNVLLVYNAFQILANAYLAFVIDRLLLRFQGDLFCMFILKDEDLSLALEIKYAGYLYFLLKFTDLMDTIFMVLKKNYHQVSFLHVYHHMGMVVATWVMTKYSRGCHEGIIGFCNVHVHVIMYSYYFISAKYPQIKQYLWLKKMITQIQLLQFVLIFIHCIIPLVNPSCTVFKGLLLILFSQSTFMIYLFSKFYYKSYIKPLRRKQQEIKNKIQ